ncbi:hypothetical protein FA10DRAFT_264606 [Acaromyces ingoldii]|uniref:FCP1 homology domain-containing protein n=1 Tax=Acaromyces ingoldii TaxID=215250 RepID=A0A316Z1F1_9BASI|nr:hypothetical protein FA10DRAFT_264606 [Acaromyces ingoldii]PWN94013.1 hypothetical protein FA10DRAFT_264606 [Acaromyces ingoldii]
MSRGSGQRDWRRRSDRDAHAYSDHFPPGPHAYEQPWQQYHQQQQYYQPASYQYGQGYEAPGPDRYQAPPTYPHQGWAPYGPDPRSMGGPSFQQQPMANPSFYATSSWHNDRYPQHNSFYDRPRRYHCERTYGSDASSSKESTRPGRSARADKRPAHYSAGGSHSYPRPSGKRAASIRTKPRLSYLRQASANAKLLEGEDAIDAHLPLLVLDLNGTLVFRGSGRTNMESRSQRPTRRPYLRVFLQYCLGIPDTVWEAVSSDPPRRADLDDSLGAMELEKQSEEDNSVEEQGNSDDGREDALFEARMAAWSDREVGRLGPSRQLHGSHFWQRPASGEPPHPPIRSPQANFRLLVWSSAQPQNVDAMTRAIFTPDQAAQLLRVLARDTLLPRRDYSRKAPSTKDLEIIWAALNRTTDDQHDVRLQSGNEGERRLLAEARDEQDRDSPDDEHDEEEQDAILKSFLKEGRSQNSSSTTINEMLRGAARRSARRADDFVVNGLGQGEAGRRGWGPHNTLLLDDSADKARLQPYNHVLVSEFDAEKASRFRRRTQDGLEEDVDDSLLQAIGVLEHAKRHENVSAWIQQGGLGFFGGLKQTGVQDEREEARTNEVIEDDDKPRLDEKPQNRTPTFWKGEGIKALARLGIEPHVQ